MAFSLSQRPNDERPNKKCKQFRGLVLIRYTAGSLMLKAYILLLVKHGFSLFGYGVSMTARYYPSQFLPAIWLQASLSQRLPIILTCNQIAGKKCTIPTYKGEGKKNTRKRENGEVCT